MVEHCVCNAGVGGSSPPVSTLGTSSPAQSEVRCSCRLDTCMGPRQSGLVLGRIHRTSDNTCTVDKQRSLWLTITSGQCAGHTEQPVCSVTIQGRYSVPGSCLSNGMLFAGVQHSPRVLAQNPRG